MPLLGTSVPAGVHCLNVSADYRQVRVIASHGDDNQAANRLTTLFASVLCNVATSYASQTLLTHMTPSGSRLVGYP